MSDGYRDDGSEPELGDLEACVWALERIVAESTSVPLSGSIWVNEAELAELVEVMHESLPNELRRARRVLEERDDLLEATDERAREMIRDAEEERERLVSRTEVLAAAEQERDQILAEARQHARQLRLEAEDYVDAKLATFESVLNDTLDTVERGRGRLQHAAPGGGTERAGGGVSDSAGGGADERARSGGTDGPRAHDAAENAAPAGRTSG